MEDPVDREPTADDRLEALLERLGGRGIRPGLETVERVLGRFGDPHFDLPVVLVAGTNGKGSTAALLTAMVRAAGYSVGLYTSPHLERISEVLSLAPPDQRAPSDQSIAGELAMSLAETVELAEAQDLPLTPFEALTIAALRSMARHRVELAVVEVGLGGRLDATNVCRPLLSILTTVDLDHQRFLGTERSAIAEHKAGIFRRGRPAIIGWCDVVEPLLRELASRAGAEPVMAGKEVLELDIEARTGETDQRVMLETRRHRHELRLPLAGDHQARNLALAVLAAEHLARAGYSRLDSRAIADGCRAVSWPGRLEQMGPGVLLDTAHNPAAARALLSELKRRKVPWNLLFGTLADKDARGMLDILAPAARRIVLTSPEDPRAWEPTVVAARLPFATTVIPDLGSALAMCLPTTEPGHRWVVTGSLRLVGQARAWLRRRPGSAA